MFYSKIWQPLKRIEMRSSIFMLHSNRWQLTLPGRKNKVKKGKEKKGPIFLPDHSLPYISGLRRKKRAFKLMTEQVDLSDYLRHAGGLTGW